MGTQKQKKIAKLIIENATLDQPLNGAELVANSGYGESMSKNPQVILQSQGVLEELEIAGFNEQTAKQVVVDIMLDPKVDTSSRLKATDQVFKVRGSYAPEKKLNLNMNSEVMSTEDIETIAQQLNDIARSNNRPSVSSNGVDSNVVDAEIQG